MYLSASLCVGGGGISQMFWSSLLSASSRPTARPRRVFSRRHTAFCSTWEKKVQEPVSGSRNRGRRETLSS